MIEDCRLIDPRQVPIAAGGAAVAVLPSSHLPSSLAAAPAEVLAFAPRPQVPAREVDKVDRSTPVSPDQHWRRRVAGLQRLGQQRTNRPGLRVMWPANDRGRKPGTDLKSTLPLHILTGAVVAFAGGLLLAGAGSLVAHPEFLPSLTAWLP